MEHTSRMTCDVPQLDLLLGGGILRGSLLLIGGTPGSGKTVLATQIAWQAAKRGERVLLITAYSEPHIKLLAHLQMFDFFDQDQLGSTMKLLSLQQQLTIRIEDAAELVVREAREHNAHVVVLDGFQGVRIGQRDPLIAHQFLFDLSAKLGLLNITTIVTHDLSTGGFEPPELTAVDAVVNLAQELHSESAIRTIQVIKNRGMAPLLGLHSFSIDSSGVVCYPRQETIHSTAVSPITKEVVAFGLARLDAMLGGGVQRGTATIVAGAEGVGKTLLGLHYLKAGLDRGNRAVVLGFHETPHQLIARSHLIGLDLQAAIEAGQVTIIHHVPVELNVDMVALQLRQAIATNAPERLLIDGVNELERPLLERGRIPGFFAALLAYLRDESITTCLTLEIDPVLGHGASWTSHNLAALSDNVMLLHRSIGDSQPSHSLSILKMRFGRHERQAQPYTIGDQGIEFTPTAPPQRRSKNNRGSF